jgi:hypothetical protein
MQRGEGRGVWLDANGGYKSVTERTEGVKNPPKLYYAINKWPHRSATTEKSKHTRKYHLTIGSR